MIFFFSPGRPISRQHLQANATVPDAQMSLPSLSCCLQSLCWKFTGYEVINAEQKYVTTARSNCQIIPTAYAVALGNDSITELTQYILTYQRAQTPGHTDWSAASNSANTHCGWTGFQLFWIVTNVKLPHPQNYCPHEIVGRRNRAKRTANTGQPFIHTHLSFLIHIMRKLMLNMSGCPLTMFYALFSSD